MKHVPLTAGAALALLALVACNPTPAEKRAIQCGGATLGGAVLGAAAGNQFGGGTGQTIMTVAGGAAGASAGQAVGC